MPLQIVRNDITKMEVDAIVSPGNGQLTLSGGVSGAIYSAAGPMMEDACRKLGGCGTGEAKITPGFLLPCRYVIHTVSPVWQGGDRGERELLSACYTNALRMAVQYGCRSIAFPMLGTGHHGYPKDQALRVANDVIADFLFRYVPDNDLMVYLVTYTKESLTVGSKLYADIRRYIDDRYVEEHFDAINVRRPIVCSRTMEPLMAEKTCSIPDDGWNPQTLEDALRMQDESFAQMLLRKIQEKGITNAECYHKACIDKKHFSKMINKPDYHPRKETVLALAIALELPLDETKELLAKAGLALTRNSKLDIITEFYIIHGKYDIFEINETLFDHDQVLLGSVIQ